MSDGIDQVIREYEDALRTAKVVQTMYPQAKPAGGSGVWWVERLRRVVGVEAYVTSGMGGRDRGCLRAYDVVEGDRIYARQSAECDLKGFAEHYPAEYSVLVAFVAEQTGAMS